MRRMTPEEALEYHSRGRKGKIEVVSSKPCRTAEDLSLAYSPGVAEPCLAIAKDPDKVYEYTTKGNLVAVISNGTAVLGLGNIGALAGKPVMEGKGVLFKRFADIDVFDIEIESQDPAVVIETVAQIAPTFGGINLEDIKSPECFEIEEALKKRLKIPVFHDDQHGTAIISAAAFLNALEVVGKKIDNVKVVFCGAGASAIACAKLYLAYGVRRENLRLVDRSGVIYLGRTEDMNPHKAQFAVETFERTLADALTGADVFIGLSAGGIVKGEMLKGMARDPIVFALANPDPEITPEDAQAARPDVIMATGRSDYPNQVNNVLGFPFIFRGALDVRATEINEEMKRAASQALAALAKMDVPDSVSKAYGGQSFRFGREYLIPKPFDPRVLLWVAPAVAEAAMRSGVAREPDHGHGRVPAPARGDALALERGHERRPREGAARPQAHRLPGRRAPQGPARGQDPGRGRDLPPDPARPRAGDREARPRARAADGEDRLHQHEPRGGSARVRREARATAAAPRHDDRGGRPAGARPQRASRR